MTITQQRLANLIRVSARACVLAAAFGLLAANHAAAQKWPEKSVRIVTPFTTGGGTDVFGRLLAQRLSETLGQQFIVDNRPGAGSTTGTDYVAKAPPDGYTLLITSASFTFNPGLYSKLRYDSVRDFARVSQVVRVPHVIVVLPSFPASNVQDLVRIARAKPGQVLYASSGPGSALHLAGALFGVVTGTQLTHVPYKGGTAAATAILSGEATVAFCTIETIMTLIQAGRLKPLAVSTRERAPALPQVPTVAESGFKNYEVVGWFGIMAPAATPKPVVDLLSREIAKAMATPAMRERAAQDGATPVGSTPEEFDRAVRADIVKWTKIIHDAGIKLD